MSGDNQISNQFKVGITREEFIADYIKIKENSGENPSVFNDSFKESIGAVFDFLNTNQSNDGSESLDADEISVFSNLDTSDGENVLSDKDITIIREKLSKEKNVSAKDRFYQEVRQDSEHYGKDLDKYLAKLEDESSEDSKIEKLIEKERIKSQKKINEYEEQIDRLVQQSDALTQEEKNNYRQQKDKLINLRQKQSETERKIKEKEREIKQVQAKIEQLNTRMKNYNDTEENTPDIVSDESASLSSRLTSLQSEYDDLIANNSNYKKQISQLENSMKATQRKAASRNEKIKNKINNLNEKIDNEKSKSALQIRTYENQLELVRQQREFAIQQISVQGEPRGEFSDEDTSAEWTQSAEELKNKWQNKKPHLTDEFYKKVVAIAGRLNCDPNALMGIMNAESGIKPQAVNKNGGATGLIQFMPKTAQGLGTSTSELYNMSAEEQLVYVERFLTKCKKTAGFADGEEMSAGQVYALVFLPARARREVLTTSDEIYYQANSRTDINGDGQITKSELDQRARKFMA